VTYTATQEIRAAATDQQLWLRFAGRDFCRLVDVGPVAPVGIPRLPGIPVEKSQYEALLLLKKYLHRINPDAVPSHTQVVTSPMRSDGEARAMTLFWSIPDVETPAAYPAAKGLTLSELFLPRAILVARADGKIHSALPSISPRGISAPTYHVLVMALPAVRS
jgi:hypothetical protein